MKKPVFENENFVLYSPDSLKGLNDKLEDILNETLDTYKELFDIEDFRKVQINYFDNLDEFREFICGLRGESKSLPEYARGTFDKGMINAYVDPAKAKTIKKLYMASHELFHIMYQELVWEKSNEDRIIWFDEGMAQFFSGENKNTDYDVLLERVKENTKVYPELNKISHGNSFKNDDYNGYNISLLSVHYLHEKLGHEGFKELMHDTDRIKKYGETVLEEVIKNNKKEFIKKQ